LIQLNVLGLSAITELLNGHHAPPFFSLKEKEKLILDVGGKIQAVKKEREIFPLFPFFSLLIFQFTEKGPSTSLSCLKFLGAFLPIFLIITVS